MKRLLFHSLAQNDVNEALAHYNQISPKLAESFWVELQFYIRRIRDNPKEFHFETAPYRRVNLSNFPYAIVYRITRQDIKIIVIKHFKRKDRYGLRRTFK